MLYIKIIPKYVKKYHKMICYLLQNYNIILKQKRNFLIKKEKIMLNFLGAETNNIGWTIAMGVLIVLMVVYLVWGTINRKKSQEQAIKMLSELKAGDKIVTNAGIYGEIVSQKETNMGRVVTIKTGEDGGKASYITINSTVILGIDQKQDILTDAQGNVIEPETAKEEVLKGTEENKEAVAETQEEKKEEKKKATKAKKPSKKSQENNE